MTNIINEFGKGKLLVTISMTLLLCISVGCNSKDATTEPSIQPDNQGENTPITESGIDNKPEGSDAALTAPSTSSSADSVPEQALEVNDTKADIALETAPITSEEIAPSEDNTQVVLAADAGQKRYEATCKICHDAGLLQAPKRGDKAAWQPRIAKGADILHKHSAEGYNKMPAQANDSVPKEEVYAAVDYLIAQSS